MCVGVRVCAGLQDRGWLVHDHSHSRKCVRDHLSVLTTTKTRSPSPTRLVPPSLDAQQKGKLCNVVSLFSLFSVSTELPTFFLDSRKVCVIHSN